MITGFGFAAGSCNDHTLAETFFAVRQHPTPRLLSVGAAAQGVYVADKGFAGDRLHRQWDEDYGAQVVSPPHQRSKVRWSKDWRRRLAGLRQIIESIYGKLLNTFRLARERPHALDGFQARLAAKVALHNFCLWLNLQLGREPLAFADLLDWEVLHVNSHQTFKYRNGENQKGLAYSHALATLCWLRGLSIRG